MSTVPMPPGRAYYLRIFAISLIIIVAVLVAFLFGVRMEAGIPATGILQARHQQNLRAPISGAVELGWFEGLCKASMGKAVAFRVDGQGNGLTDPTQGASIPIEAWLLADGRTIKAAAQTFHSLSPGDELWPGQILAWVRSAAANPATVKGLVLPPPAGAECHAVRVPEKGSLWQVLKVHAEHKTAVLAGTSLATIVPIDPQTHEPVEVLARLEIAEEAAEDLQVGQQVRIFSNVFNPRLHGSADATLVSIDPLVETNADGKRYFHATAAIDFSPFPLRLGSGVTAKIIVGRKTVYRIILEH